MNVLLSRPLMLAVRVAVGAVFAVAGFLKLQDPRGFAMVIDGYGLTPGWLDLPLAYALPVLEIISGIGLIFNIRWALELVIAQLVLFIAVLAYGIHLGLDADCGCFGPGDPEGEAYHGMRGAIVKDLFMLGGCILLLWRWMAMNEPPRPLSVILKPFGGKRR